jgi:cystathionine beta-lyase family protein involved in aluminum resistance
LAVVDAQNPASSIRTMALLIALMRGGLSVKSSFFKEMGAATALLAFLPYVLEMVTEALLCAELVAEVFHDLGYRVNPLPGAHRSDGIQAVRFGAPEPLKVVCKAFQGASPIGSYLDPIPAPMPGYASELVMAGGTFIDGSTSEFSADAPLREPYVLYAQGGTHRAHAALALERALVALAGQGLLP